MEREAGERLPGNVGGAWRVGDTVRRAAGPWTPPVHALVEYLRPRSPRVPQALGFDDQGNPRPWRLSLVGDRALVVAHNDIAPYNVCFDGDDLAGVFDWDLAGPSTALFELAFIAWNCVPLWRDTGAQPPERSRRFPDDLVERLPAIAVLLA